MSASAPHGLPTPNPTRSYWQTAPASFADHNSAAPLPARADYVVVGSGIAGARTALALLQRHPEARVVMLEARQVASGATGRNGGHCRGGMYVGFGGDAAALGAEEALRIQAFEARTVAAAASFVEQHGVQCDFRALETADVFTDAATLERARASLDALDASFPAGKPAWVPDYKFWPADEARRETGFVGALGAVTFAGYALQPYLLVCAMLRMAMGRGLELFTHAAVHAVRAQGEGGWAVETARGSVAAARVVLATNAYTAALYPPLAEHIVATRGQMTLLRPGAAAAASPALRRTFAAYNPVSMEYCQARGSGADVEVLLGGGRLHEPRGEQPVFDDGSVSPVISKYLAGAMAEYAGEGWRDAAVAMEWTGIMANTKDGRPFVGEAPGQPGLYLCCGFNGHGMALAFSAAEGVVEMMDGESAEWVPRSFATARIAGGA